MIIKENATDNVTEQFVTTKISWIPIPLEIFYDFDYKNI